MKKLFIICAIWLTALTTWAVKALPFPVQVVQPDGSTLIIIQHGDEYFHYVTTYDGVLLWQQADGYYVAAVDATGELLPTTQLAHNAAQRGFAEQLLVSSQDRERFLTWGGIQQGIARSKQEPVTVTDLEFPHVGSPKAIVILTEFADTTFSMTNPKASFEHYFNGEGEPTDYGFGEKSNYESVYEYFKKCSFGQYTPQFDVYGPVQVSGPLVTYGGTNPNGKGEHMDLLLNEACALMDDSLDFSQYDANGDGCIDLAIVLYAGYSQAVSGNKPECIWPKSGNILNGNTFDGVTLSRYAVSSELNGFPGCYQKAPLKRINGIGVLCHELSHCLGLPDFYPTDNNIKGDNQAMEFWDLMDSGCYLINGTAPVAYTAWEREALGWFALDTLTTDTIIDNLLPIDEGGKAYRILNDNDATEREYFIVENIQARGLNIRQKGHGLLLSHVDYSPSLFDLQSNKVNNTKGHPRMTVVPADGLLFAQYNIDGVHYNNQDFYNQLAGDPFPGTSYQTFVNDTTGLVNFQVYKGVTLNKALVDISESPEGAISFKFISDFAQSVAGIRECEPGSMPADDRVFSLDGRYVGQAGSQLPKGIYITRGRKIVIK